MKKAKKTNARYCDRCDRWFKTGKGRRIHERLKHFTTDGHKTWPVQYVKGLRATNTYAPDGRLHRSYQVDLDPKLGPEAISSRMRKLVGEHVNLKKGAVMSAGFIYMMSVEDDEAGKPVWEKRPYRYQTPFRAAPFEKFREDAADLTEKFSAGERIGDVAMHYYRMKLIALTLIIVGEDAPQKAAKKGKRAPQNVAMLKKRIRQLEARLKKGKSKPVAKVAKAVDRDSPKVLEALRQMRGSARAGVGRSGGYIADVADASGLSPTRLREALLRLAKAGKVALYPEDNGRSRTPRRVAAAVNLSGVPQHLAFLLGGK